MPMRIRVLEPIYFSSGRLIHGRGLSSLKMDMRRLHINQVDRRVRFQFRQKHCYFVLESVVLGHLLQRALVLHFG